MPHCSSSSAPKNTKTKITLEEEYIQSLKDHEKLAYKIAKRQLKSSFSLKKSIGYKKFIEEKRLKHK